MAALAPGVSYPLAGHRPTQWVVASLLALWGLALLWWLQAWSGQWARMPLAWWSMAVALTLTAAAWGLVWSREPGPMRATLVWDPLEPLGRRPQGVWRLFTPAWPTGLRSTHVVPVLDLQVLLLLQFQAPEGLRVWCWLWRGSQPPAWLALRRAVFHQPVQQTRVQTI